MTEEENEQPPSPLPSPILVGSPEPDRAELGWYSLYLTVGGIIGPLVLFILVRSVPGLRSPPGHLSPAEFACFLLIPILEYTALAMGIAARRTFLGKAGIAISLVLLLLVALLVLLWFTLRRP